jgi:hypothetical protein
MMNTLKKSLNERESWNLDLPFIENTKYNALTKSTSFDLLLGRKNNRLVDYS